MGEWAEAAEAYAAAAASAPAGEREPERLAYASCLLELGRAGEVLAVLDEVDESGLDDAVNVLQGSELDEARQPQLAISSQGDVAIAFGIGTDVYCVTSRAAIPAATNRA